MLATQLLPQNFRRPATLETKGLLQTQSHLLNQIVCVTVSEGVVPTEVGTDYAVIENVDHLGTGTANIVNAKQAFDSNGKVETLPLTDVEEVVRYACSDSARGLAQCSVQGQALISSCEDPGSNNWTLRYVDSRFNPNTRIFARMDASSPGIAAVSRPLTAGSSNGRQCVFMPVFGAGGAPIAILRAEKNVTVQAVGMNGNHKSHFSDDEIDALHSVSQHCGSILQASCMRLYEIAKKTLQGVLAPELTPMKRSSAAAADDISGTFNVVTPAWCVRSLHEKQRRHLEDLSMKACISLQCSKVSILLLEKDRHWLIQLAYSVLHKKQNRTLLSCREDEANVYEGYKNNSIAQLAIGSGECVVVHNVNIHAGYDSGLDALAGIIGRNCLAAPIMAGESKSNTRCVGVLFATNKSQGSFLGPDVVIAGAFADAAASTLAGLLDKIPQLRTSDDAKPTPVKRSEGETADVEEMRSVLNALQGMAVDP